jgi:outer membrane receptor for monomeric catechols
MKGYEDLVAGLLLLIVILIGGYTYLNSQVIKQREVLQVPAAAEKNVEKRAFESLSKVTE